MCRKALFSPPPHPPLLPAPSAALKLVWELHDAGEGPTMGGGPLCNELGYAGGPYIVNPSSTPRRLCPNEALQG